MSGSRTAFFDNAYERNFEKITKYVVSKCSDVNDVKEIVQDVFVEFYRLIEKKGADFIRNDEAMLMRLTKFKIFRHYNAAEKMKSVIWKNRLEDMDAAEEDPEDIEVGESFLNAVTVEEIWKIISGRPNEVKRIFYLFYYCGMSIREIADTMKIGESKVKHGIYGTLREIRRIYKVGD